MLSYEEAMERIVKEDAAKISQIIAQERDDYKNKYHSTKSVSLRQSRLIDKLLDDGIITQDYVDNFYASEDSI